MPVDAETLGRAGRFEELLALLREAGYTDDSIRTRWALRHAEDFDMDRARRPPVPPPDSPADLLADLFLAGDPADESALHRLLGGGAAELLREMGLLQTRPVGQEVAATVALYPVRDLYIASDRWNCPAGEPFAAADDFVYPAFVPNTRIFLDHLPERSRRFLDLCAGTGAAALAAARRGAPQAWSADITDRCTGFARFNARLNALPAVRAVTSDLYGELAGESFDFIAAHPPYVPSLTPKWIFFSGGEDGEDIIRRIVQGLPEHLEPGGIFLSLTMGSDRSSGAFEDRVREWLGASRAEFDVALIVRSEMDPLDFAQRANRETIRSVEESTAWRKRFEALGTTALVCGLLVIRRHRAPRAVFSVRRRAPHGRARAPWEWLLAWEELHIAPGLTRLVLDSRLYAAKDTEFHVVHRLGDGCWDAHRYRLETGTPFVAEAEAQPWMAHLLALCDGVRTGREILQLLRENDAVPPATPEREFADAVASLVSAGFAGIDALSLPPAAGRPAPSGEKKSRPERIRRGCGRARPLPRRGRPGSG